MMIWKKVSVIILIVGIIINPVAVSSQTGEVGADKFQEEASGFWNKAVATLSQIYDSIKSFLQQSIQRLVEIWEGIKRWVNDQITTLREAFRKDTEKAGETVKEEVGQAKKSLWQTILEAVGIGGGK